MIHRQHRVKQKNASFYAFPHDFQSLFFNNLRFAIGGFFVHKSASRSSVPMWTGAFACPLPPGWLKTTSMVARDQLSIQIGFLFSITYSCKTVGARRA
jgi:hypothetical protein